MDIVQTLESLVPGAQYGGYPRDREHYENLRWGDERPQPTWEQIEAAAPVAAAPTVVSRAQGKAALVAAGLWPSVSLAVDAIENETEKALAFIALHDTGYWRRDSPFLLKLASGLGLSDQELADLFTAAGQIEL